MTPERTAALATLRSPNFFAYLRGAVAQQGLAREERFGVGIFFTMISSFRPNPLRVALQETTEGTAKYTIQRVATLFHPGTVCGVWSEPGWSRLAEDPMCRTAYVRQWSDDSDECVRFETNGNRIVRVTGRKQNGRIVETPETIEGRFACIAQQYPWESPDRSRWLTIQLPAPPLAVPAGITALSVDEIAMWKEVQRLLQMRGKRTVVLPDWADIVVEQACEKERGSRYLPVFLQSWRTMAMLRSFGKDERVDYTSGQENMIKADFDDLAMTSLLVRGVFREGCWFPSVAKIFNKVYPVGRERSVINPHNGKGVRYTHRANKLEPWDFVGLFT
jgi:hypothetical protein